jgi:hypothetical protein
LAKGLEQLDRYLARLDQSIGWLIIFDRRDNEEELCDRLTTEQIQTDTGRTITVIRA